MTLTELKTKLQEKKLEATFGLLVALSTPLFLVIWQGWLYGALARTGAVIPRRVLGAVIGILLIWLVASLGLTVLYARALRAAEREKKTLSNLPITPGLKQSHAYLTSLNTNLPTNRYPDEHRVAEYHGVLALVEKETAQNLDRFRVAPGDFVPGSEGRYCEREAFLMRVRGVINFLNK